jgi:hypothetical protein
VLQLGPRSLARALADALVIVIKSHVFNLSPCVFIDHHSWIRQSQWNLLPDGATFIAATADASVTPSTTAGPHSHPTCTSSLDNVTGQHCDPTTCDFTAQKLLGMTPFQLWAVPNGQGPCFFFPIVLSMVCGTVTLHVFG